MKSVVLACTTIRQELEKAAREARCDYPFVWVESGMHLVPANLRRRLQEELDRITGVDRVLLAFGFCGHAVLGLKAREFELVLPRVDDCITLLLGSEQNRERCTREGGTYFLTRGWLEDEINIWKEYQAVRARFGAERTAAIYRRMLVHYRFLGLIDTGAYDLQALFPRVREIAATLELEAKVVPGSDSYLRKFFNGPWDSADFVTIPPATSIELSHLGLY